MGKNLREEIDKLAAVVAEVREEYGSPPWPKNSGT